GAVAAVNRYDEYGNPQGGAITGRFGYTGQAWLPELGMYYYRARIYNPELGRFMQPDPIGYGSGMNLYAFVGGDPVNLADPGGMAGTNICTGTRLCHKVDWGHQQQWGGASYVTSAAGLASFRGGSRGGGGGGGSPATGSAGSTSSTFPGGDSIIVTAAPLIPAFDLNSVGGIPLSQAILVTARRSWTISDFVRHYFHGGGATVDLRDVGLGETFRNSEPVRRALAPFLVTLFLTQPTVLYTQREYINLTTTIFPIGDTQLYMAGMCHDNSCFYRAGIWDWFRDPLDIGLEFRSGTPYQIHYEWGENLQIPSWARRGQ
ncbi:MAG: RHS repeat-associated core domain-containing protein, partial [Pseudomonadota bacterium]|nr:RHS repeat-associated core domain-containing protein [Pseudomonadota bacterium]